MVLALFGLGLLGYLIMHLTANFQILGENPQTLDVYAHTLLSLGPLLIAIEIALALVFLVHIYLAIVITLQNRSARPDRYEMIRDAGPPSKKDFSSRTMIYCSNHAGCEAVCPKSISIRSIAIMRREAFKAIPYG